MNRKYRYWLELSKFVTAFISTILYMISFIYYFYHESSFINFFISCIYFFLGVMGSILFAKLTTLFRYLYRINTFKKIMRREDHDDLD